MSLPSPSITSIVTESNSFRVAFAAGSPPAGAHTNSVTLFVNEKNNTDFAFPIYTIFESSIAAEADIPASFLIELEVPPQFNVGATYVMSISQSFSDGSEAVSNTDEKDYVLNAKPLKPVIYDATANDVAAGDQVVSFYLDTGASQGSAVLSITGRSFNVAAGQYVTHQCPINSATLTRAGSSGTKMKVRKTIVGDPEHADNLYYCVLLNLENGVHYEHRFSTINAVGKSESCNVFTSTPTNEVLAVTDFALDSSIMDYIFTASWNALTIPNHDDFESRVTGYKLDYEYTDASYNAVTATFDASSNILADQTAGGRVVISNTNTAPNNPVVPATKTTTTTTLGFISDPLQVAEEASGVSIVNGFPTILTSAQMTSAKADSNPTLITAGADQDGWTIDNTGAVVNAKVNLYFYANQVDAASQTGTNSFTLNDATGLGLYAIFDQAAGAKEYPFFNAYTTPSGSVNKASWYKSNVFYGPQSNNGNTLTNANNVGLTLAYTGTDNPALFPHIVRRVKYEVKEGANLTNANSGYASELIKYLTLQTSSQTVSAGNYNFRLLETGMFTSHTSFGQLRLLYNLTGKVAATIYATTDNSGDGALSDVKSIRVFDLPMDLRPGNPGDYTISAHDQGIRVNIQLNAATLAYLSNRSELTHIVISLLDASYNPVQDASYNVLQDASGNNTLNLNHSFAALNNGISYIISMQLFALNPNPSESTEVIYGELVEVTNIVPYAPGDAVLATATGSNGKVTFGWPMATDLQGGVFVKYVIQHRGSSGTDVIREETDSTVTSYERTGLTNGTTYYFTFYVVTRAYTGSEVNGDATYLEEIPFREADAPTSITLTPSDQRIEVDWPVAVFNGSILSYYRVELFYSVDDTFFASQDVYLTEAAFSGLTNGTSYYATVTVITTNPNNVNDQRQGGSITSSSKIPFGMPHAPSVVNLDAGDQQMTVNWSMAVTNGSDFKEYLVELFPGSHSTTVTPKETLTHTFTGLTNGTSYYGRVTVYATKPNPNPDNSFDVISGGATSSLSKKPLKPANAPASILLTPGDEQVQVDWTADVFNGTDFDSYWVTLFSGEVGSGTFYRAEPRALTTSHPFLGLTNGTSYYATVTVYTTNPNDGTRVTGGTITSSSKIPSRAPTAPNSVVLEAGDEQMRVNWSAAELNGSVLPEYVVKLYDLSGNEYTSSGNVYDSSGNVLTHARMFTGLTNGTAYYATVTVYATNPNDGTQVTGGQTTSDSQIAFGQTPPPTLAYYPGYQTLRVVWSNVQTNGGPFDSYKVQLYNSTGTQLLSEVEYSGELNLNQNTHTFYDLTIGVNYIVKVIVVTSDPNAAPPAAGGDPIDSPAGSITASPHDNPIIIGSASIDNVARTVSVTVDKNGSEITDYMAIVQPGNLMQKINDSSPVANSNGTFTLSMTFNTVSITSALMVVGNGRGFTAVEFNSSTQTVLSEQHYRAEP